MDLVPKNITPINGLNLLKKVEQNTQLLLLNIMMVLLYGIQKVEELIHFQIQLRKKMC